MKNLSLIASGILALSSLQSLALSKGDILHCRNEGASVSASKFEIVDIDRTRIKLTYFTNSQAYDGWDVIMDRASGVIYNNDEMVASGEHKIVGAARLHSDVLSLKKIGYDLKAKVCRK
jgi:hypothetical protein